MSDKLSKICYTETLSVGKISISSNAYLEGVSSYEIVSGYITVISITRFYNGSDGANSSFLNVSFISSNYSLNDDGTRPIKYTIRNYASSTATAYFEIVVLRIRVSA